MGKIVCPKAGLVSIANPVKNQTALDIRILDPMVFLLIE
jgi:hypothetical protein